MIKSKDQLANRIQSLCLRNIGRKTVQENTLKLKQKYDIPSGIANDILTLRADLETQTDFMLFCVMDILDLGQLKNYFTESEIKTYSEAKFETEHIKFPIRIRAVQVTETQWIGVIDLKTLMGFRDAQLLNYNENTQRSLRHIIKGGTEFYKITLNQKAVANIQDLIKTGQYIPNTITFNMPEDTDYKYADGVLIINSISQFDILDGYHRYISLSKLYSLDPGFQYNMELRVVCFPEGKAKQFIWQEDQKTRMKRIDSDSFNQNLEANKIVDRINGDPSFVLSGYITRNEGIINAAWMAQLINMLWFGQRMSKADTLKRSLEVRKEIQEGLETIVNADHSIVEEPWDYKFLCCVMVCIHNGTPDINIVRKVYDTYNGNIVPTRIRKNVLNRLSACI